MPQRIDAVIQSVVGQAAEHQAPLFAIQRSWPELVGEALAAHSRPVRLARGKLLVYVDHSGDGFEMSYRAPALLRRLREQTLGKIEELVVRTGRIASSASKD